MSTAARSHSSVSPSDAVDFDAIRSVLALSNSGAALFSPSGESLFVNDEMSRILGGAVSERLFDLLTPHDRATSAYVQCERFRAGKVRQVREECQIERIDGDVFWADVSVARLGPPDTPATDLPIVVHVIDIQSRKEREVSIAQSDARWETALEAAGQGMWEYDRVTGKLTLSRGWKKLRGYREDEDVSMERADWLARVHPEDRERINTASDKQGSTDEHGFDTLEYRERHRDGHYIWIYSRGRAYAFDEAGNPLKAIGTDTDITLLKTVEAELAAEKEMLRVTLQSIGDGVIATDPDGRVLLLNAAAESMTGWSQAEASGRPIADVFKSTLGDDASLPTQSAAKCLQEGTVQELTDYTRLKARNGKSRYIRETAAPIRAEDGARLGAVVVFEDSTQRRALQMELEHSATHDQLTGLPNRVALERRMADTMTEAVDEQRRHALCLIDLDHFKAVNDGAGHAAGDALLTQIGRLIAECCRKSDCVARIGGDEFAIVLSDCNMTTARRICQKVVDAIGALEFAWQEQSFRVGASIGIAQIDGKAADADEYYKSADAACYVAKRNGRNCVVVGG